MILKKSENYNTRVVINDGEIVYINVDGMREDIPGVITFYCEDGITLIVSKHLFKYATTGSWEV